MQLEVEKNNLSINQLVIHKIENVTISGDAIVPDSKPDVMNIVISNGSSCNIYKKELNDGKIRVDGSIPVYIIYNSSVDNNKVTDGLFHSLDFSQVISLENVTSEMIENSSIKLNNVNCKIINERKVNIEAEISFDIYIYNNSSEEYVNNIKNCNLQKRKSNITLCSLFNKGENNVSVNDKIEINSQDDILQILNVYSEISKVETKISYNKVLTNSNLNLKIAYITKDNRICFAKKSFPIMGFVDMKDVSDKIFLDSKVEMKNMTVTKDINQTHIINVSAEMRICIMAYEEKSVSIIQDLYSTNKNLECTKKSVNIINSKSCFTKMYSIDQNENLNIGNEKIYDMNAKFVLDKVSRSEGTAEISGNACFIFLHSTNEMKDIATKRIDVPVKCNVDTKNVIESSLINFEYNISNNNMEVLSDGSVHIKVDFQFVLNCTNFTSTMLINNAKESEPPMSNKYNMSIYFTKSDDSMWDIAKKYNSTCESIMKTNELESEVLQPGIQLFIPRVVS